jgi:hypothetical protein
MISRKGAKAQGEGRHMSQRSRFSVVAPLRLCVSLCRRWLRVTPDRIVTGLLAVEGALWLSEQFHWFPFNQHKGWTVLITIASVGVALLLMFLWFIAALVFRLRFQFSILSLLVLAIVVAVPCSWLGTEMKAANEQRAVVEAIVNLGGWVDYDYHCDEAGNEIDGAGPPRPVWLRNLFGDDLFVSVAKVEVPSKPVDDAWLENLKSLPQLRFLNALDTQVTNAGLSRLEGLTELRLLILWHTKVTAEGVKKLQKALPKCSIHIEPPGLGEPMGVGGTR